MPDTSQLLTNEPFTNENNTNKFILNFSRSDCITKKIITKRIEKNKEKREHNLTPHRCEIGKSIAVHNQPPQVER